MFALDVARLTSGFLDKRENTASLEVVLRNKALRAD
jgi:hypothetical protein